MPGAMPRSAHASPANDATQPPKPRDDVAHVAHAPTSTGLPCHCTCPRRLPGSRYVFRSRWFGQALINSWKANSAHGRTQVVKISKAVEVTVINKMNSRVSVYLRTDDKDVDDLAGDLDPTDGNPLNDAIEKIEAQDGDTIVVKSETGEVMDEVAIDTSKSGAHQRIVLRHHNREL